MKAYVSYTDRILNYYASYAINEAHGISKTDIDLQPLFLKINFVGADPEKIKMVTSVFRRTIA